MIKLIYLDDNFLVNGEISNAIVKINDKWTKIIVIKSRLSKIEAETLFKNNQNFIYGDVVYVSKGYIKTIEDEDGTYTWMKFGCSYSDADKQKIKELETKLEIQNQAIAELTLLMTMGGM